MIIFYSPLGQKSNEEQKQMYKTVEWLNRIITETIKISDFA